MTPDDATLMAYVDGELDAITARRIEQAMAQDEALAARIAAQSALRDRLRGAFQPVADQPVPDALRDMLTNNVVPLRPSPPPAQRRRWMEAVAIAATLVIGIAVGQQWQSGPVRTSGNRMLASGTLARTLDTQLAATETGDTHVLVSFRDKSGSLCRVFASAPLDGIACRDNAGWTLRQTQNSAPGQMTAYRQAGSAQGSLMAAAQDMMTGEPMDAAAEKAAIASHWHAD